MNNQKELFWQLMEPEYKKAVRFCYCLADDKDTGDDLFQESAMKAILKIDSLKEESSFKSWFFKIIMNTYKSKVRKPLWKMFIPFTSDIEISMSNDNPTEAYHARRILSVTMAKLNADEQSMLVLFEIEGWSVAELAGIFKMKENAVKVKLHRIRQKMKKQLSKYMDNSKIISETGKI